MANFNPFLLGFYTTVAVFGAVSTLVAQEEQSTPTKEMMQDKSWEKEPSHYQVDRSDVEGMGEIIITYETEENGAPTTKQKSVKEKEDLIGTIEPKSVFKKVEIKDDLGQKKDCETQEITQGFENAASNLIVEVSKERTCKAVANNNPTLMKEEHKEVSEKDKVADSKEKEVDMQMSYSGSKTILLASLDPKKTSSMDLMKQPEMPQSNEAHDGEMMMPGEQHMESMMDKGAAQKDQKGMPINDMKSMPSDKKMPSDMHNESEMGEMSSHMKLEDKTDTMPMENEATAAKQ